MTNILHKIGLSRRSNGEASGLARSNECDTAHGGALFPSH